MGRDTVKYLSELGYSEEDMKKLDEDNVIQLA
jgi:hypothetical protein